LYPQIAAEEGLSEVHMLDFDLDVVNLALGLLCTSELAARTKERRW
jgi:hypothetical protein